VFRSKISQATALRDEDTQPLGVRCETLYQKEFGNGLLLEADKQGIRPASSCDARFCLRYAAYVSLANFSKIDFCSLALLLLVSHNEASICSSWKFTIVLLG
jgi:hypothetical protein